MEINDKINNKLTSLYLSKAMKIVKSSETIKVRDLFFIFASRLSNEIKLCPKNMVYFWDLEVKQWKLIYFKAEVKKEMTEEDEAGQTDEMQVVWGEE